MTDVIPREADWESAPGLLDGAMNLAPDRAAVRPARTGFTGVAQGTLRGRARTGYQQTSSTPDYMREPGPLREALMLELGYRARGRGEGHPDPGSLRRRRAGHARAWSSTRRS